MMEAFGGKGFFVEDPKHIRSAFDEAMNFRGPALVNVVISQGSARNQQIPLAQLTLIPTLPARGRGDGRG
jgi:thiamine pyrophosphate-dependent acetolactate synthase large subunit-like protein